MPPIPTRLTIPTIKPSHSACEVVNGRAAIMASRHPTSACGHKRSLILDSPEGSLLLANTHSDALQRALVLIVVVFYGSVLGRAWEDTG